MLPRMLQKLRTNPPLHCTHFIDFCSLSALQYYLQVRCDGDGPKRVWTMMRCLHPKQGVEGRRDKGHGPWKSGHDDGRATSQGAMLYIVTMNPR
jgi:hypothetical protein